MTKSNRLRSTKLSSIVFFVPGYAPLFLLSGGGLNPAIAKAINVTIFFGILFYLLRKPISGFFKARLAEVRGMLERAAEHKEHAASRLADIDQRLNRLDDEIAEIKARAKRESESERERIRKETELDMERMRALARREIDLARQVALIDLKEFAATKSVELAEQIIRRELTAEDDARLVQRAGNELIKL